MTLAELTAKTGLDVLDHLEQQLTIPVVDGMQAQGDLIVIPFELVANTVTVWERWWREIPRAGVELLRSSAGGNPHTLVADGMRSRWLRNVRDTTNLALGVLDATDVCYLIHPEHGATGIAPGRHLIRRQRERGPIPRFSSAGMPSNRFVCD